jgi:protoheme ferro-lyase
MLNMGGPSSLDGLDDGVKPFLMRLFQDGEIIKLGPFQSTLVSYCQTSCVIMCREIVSYRYTVM